MRLLTFVPPGASSAVPGVVVTAGTRERVVDLATLVQRLGDRSHATDDALTLGVPALLEDVDLRSEIEEMVEGGRELWTGPERGDEQRPVAHELDEIRYLPPIPEPSKIIMTGSNYPDHVDEATAVGYHSSERPQRPPAPNAFARFRSTLTGHRCPVPYPNYGEQLDYEAELCVVIGTHCRDVSVAEAAGVIAGYTIINDLSIRDVQFREKESGIILFSKNADQTAPCGPWIVTADSVRDPQSLTITCRVNGEVRQQDTTANMIFSIAELVSYCSRVSLAPGDLISTGTPAGAAIFRDEPEPYLLKVGDVVEIEIDTIGRLENEIVAA